MFLNYQFILLSLLTVASVLSLEQRIRKNNKTFKTGIQVKFSDRLKRAIDEIVDKSEDIVTTTEDTEKEPKDVTTEVAVDVPKETTSDAPKEEVALNEDTKEELGVKKEAEKIEREGDDEERPVARNTTRDVEATTPHTQTPVPPVTHPTLPPVSTTVPTVPTTRPVFSYQPVYPPTNSFPNYWDNPNWGNWGRFVPTPTANWPQQWPSFNWPNVPSVPQIPNYSPSTIPNPTRYTPGSFAMIPSSSVPNFSFLVPHNPYPGGRGFQYPGSQPMTPTYPGYQPAYQPGYQPRFIPSGGHYPTNNPGFGGQQPGYQPGIGGQSPGYQPGMGGQVPNYYPEQTPNYQPANGGHGPRHYPGAQVPTQPQQPGADPNRPYGPMGPEFNDPDVTMIDTNQVPASSNTGRGLPGKLSWNGM